MQDLLRWGIFGPGIIAGRMADALEKHPVCRLHAVASRTPGKGERFAEDHADVAAMSYEELAASPDIDVIYVATTHNFHHANAKLALEHGKHVVIEKPFTVNATQARELVELARSKKLFLMEAIWTRFLPVYRRMKRELESGTIGELKLIDITMGDVAGPEYIERLTRPELAGGVTLDMGIYPISFACYLTGKIPSKIKSSATMTETGVDELAAYLIQFPGGCHATIRASFNLAMRTEATLYGGTGYIHYPGFKEGNSFTIHRHGGTNEVSDVQEIVEETHENDFFWQVDETVRGIRATRIETDIIPHDETIAIMEVMDRMRESWGLRYPFE
jgi:predicted dehydrogenase